MNKDKRKPLVPMLVIFVLLNAFFISARGWLEKKGVDQEVLIVGNLIVFAILLLSFFITQRSLTADNPNAFVRAVYGSFIIKFFVLAIAAFVYIMITKEKVNKPALISCMGLYLVYTFLEISALLRLLKERKNA